MGLLSNNIRKETLKAGDHIYSWRAKWTYAHHGIYAGDEKVIHFTRGEGQETGTGTVIDVFLVSSSPISPRPCLVCRSYKVSAATKTSGVTSSCLSCFLAGGALYRFEYAVSTAFFFAKVRGGTCTRAPADPDEVVVRRANYLLRNGFRCYSLFKNNCEDFAIYCKTGLIVAEEHSAGIGQSGQAVSMCGAAAATAGALIAGGALLCAGNYVSGIVNTPTMLKDEVKVQGIVSTPARLKLAEVKDHGKKKKEEEGQISAQPEQPGSITSTATAIIGTLITAPVVYCVFRYTFDIGKRPNMLKVDVEDLTAGVASGRIRPANMATLGQVQARALTTFVAA